MNTVKDLLLSKLTATGFIYYPEMKRLMFKKENIENAEVIVVELDKECRVYFSKTNNMLNYTEDRKFGYNADQILNHVDALMQDNTTKFKTAA